MSMSFSSGDKTYQIELNNMISSYKNNGVLDGLQITPQASMTLNVTAGQCHVDHEVYEETSTTTVTIAAAHATLPRLDIVYYDTSAGEAATTSGAAAAHPLTPVIPDGDVLLALIEVPAAVTTILIGYITDERIPVKPFGLIYVASDTLLDSSDSEEYHGSITYTNEKEITIPDDIFSNDSELRIKFDLKSANMAITVYGRIYRNGVAVGTERSTTSTSYVNFSDDISGWSAGDLIQLYTRTAASGIVVYVQNFRVYGDFDSKNVFNW